MMALRFIVASLSDWQPLRNIMPAMAGGTHLKASMTDMVNRLAASLAAPYCCTCSAPPILKLLQLGCSAQISKGCLITWRIQKHSM